MRSGMTPEPSQHDSGVTDVTLSPLEVAGGAESVGESPTVAHIVLLDGHSAVDLGTRDLEGARYSRESLKCTLRLMGCKGRFAYAVAERVFKRAEASASGGERRKLPAGWFREHHREGVIGICMPRSDFMRLLVREGRANRFFHEEDLRIASSIQEKRRSFCLLLCGTSGTGKSTMSSLLGTRLGVTLVMSTDSIRHALRGFVDRADNPLLYASTYQAGNHFDPDRTIGLEHMSERERVIKGYKAQSAEVMEHLERVIGSCEARKESLVCEGVHLNLGFVVRLMVRHPSVVPFLICISNESKHRERFAVRAKYMALDPGRNRYIRHFGNIRLIQSYLLKKAEKFMIPVVNNNNMDRSIGVIHATLIAAMKRVADGAELYSRQSGTAELLHCEHESVKRAVVSNKDMLQLLRLRAAKAAGEGGASTSLHCGAGPSSSSGPAWGSRSSSASSSAASFAPCESATPPALPSVFDGSGGAVPWHAELHAAAGKQHRPGGGVLQLRPAASGRGPGSAAPPRVGESGDGDRAAAQTAASRASGGEEPGAAALRSASSLPDIMLEAGTPAQRPLPPLPLPFAAASHSSAAAQAKLDAPGLGNGALRPASPPAGPPPPLLRGAVPRLRASRRMRRAASLATPLPAGVASAQPARQRRPRSGACEPHLPPQAPPSSPATLGFSSLAGVVEASPVREVERRASAGSGSTGGPLADGIVPSDDDDYELRWGSAVAGYSDEDEVDATGWETGSVCESLTDIEAGESMPLTSRSFCSDSEQLREAVLRGLHTPENAAAEVPPPSVAGSSLAEEAVSHSS